MKSKPFSMPKIMSERSRSLIKGMESLVPGTFMPLWFETFPPFITEQTMSVSLTFWAFISTNPSSMRTLAPGARSLGRSL